MDGFIRQQSRAQLWLFRLILLGYIISILPKMFGEGKTFAVASGPVAVFILSFYVYLILIVFLVHGIVYLIKPLRLWFYYKVWIDGVYEFMESIRTSSSEPVKEKIEALMRLMHLDIRISKYVLDSFPRRIPEPVDLPLSGHKKDHGRLVQKFSVDPKKPLFVRREHLLFKNFWKAWSFAALVLFEKIKIKHKKTKHGKDTYILDIDLRNQSYGIYNNGGKYFLKEYFMDSKMKSICKTRSQEIEEFMKEGGYVSELEIKDVPFRWASGGVLPVARWQHKLWYVLSLRELEPVGWNIANGSSETKEEYKNLTKLIYREFSEEIIVLDGAPLSGANHSNRQKIFRYLDPHDDFQESIQNRDFVRHHASLRGKCDDIYIDLESDDAETGPQLSIIPTPFDIHLRWHERSFFRLKDEEHTKQNILWVINPYEFGIEAVLVAKFRLDDDDYIMSGEIWEGHEALGRQPIMLLSCQYLHDLYKKNGTLGELMSDASHSDCKAIKKIPKNAYHIFDKDVDLRRSHVDRIAENVSQLDKDVFDRDVSWLELYEKLFLDLRDNKTTLDSAKHKPLTVLCPTTWKAIETVCRFNILKP